MTKIFQSVHHFLTISLFFTICLHSKGQHVQFSGNRTVTWKECIEKYALMDDQSEFAKLIECGRTDVGKPLHLFVINKDQVFYRELFDRKKSILLINNGIHPGEPDGIDASLIFAQELLAPSSELSSLLDSVIICIIPIYNVDGALNRGSYSRANQNGPEEYGFRGNARNLDLNRDFIKCDSQNAKSFSMVFNQIKPHLFVDTHVSNGADYPYTMTLISTQSDKLGGVLGKFLKTKLEPALFESMKACGQEMCPYVNTMGRTPESGLVEFLETPRFASGYAALFNTIGFITETHMLKPFDQRVESTYAFLITLLKYVDQHSSLIVATRKMADADLLEMKKVALSFDLDTTNKSTILFNGYEAKSKPSIVGSGDRLIYDHNATWSREIPMYGKYKPGREIEVPAFYIVPQAWSEVIERLRYNHVMMEPLGSDTTMNVEVYIIDGYETAEKPYEGHYLHSEIKTSKQQKQMNFYKGDYLISTAQPARRYLCEVLEPESVDGFFAWNFFDSVLQQKEWFSDYVFEDIAAELLLNDEKLKKSFEAALLSEAGLKDSHWNQLYWIYKHSEYFEKSSNRFPVCRIN